MVLKLCFSKKDQNGNNEFVMLSPKFSSWNIRQCFELIKWFSCTLYYIYKEHISDQGNKILTFFYLIGFISGVYMSNMK